MSLMDDVITKLRAATSGFGTRIAGAAELAVIEDDEIRSGLGLPFALVVPIREAVDASHEDGLQTTVIEEFGVVIGVDNTPDTRGQASAAALEALRDEVITALVGWTPTPTDTIHQPVKYIGGEFLDMDREALVFVYDFSTERAHV